MTKDSKYNYIDIFSDLFFDVDKSENKTVKEIVQQVDIILSSIIVRFGELENELNYNDEEKEVEEKDYDNSRTNLVIMTLIRKIMEQLDAINILYSKCSFSQTQVILRSMIENVVSLEFILKEDTDFRAAAYFMERHYQEIQKTKECCGNNSILNGNISVHEFQQLKSNLINKEKAINNLVYKYSLIRKVDAKRKSILSSNKGKRLNWYEVSGPKNFRELMKEVDLDKYYSGIYGGLSLETHALNAPTEIFFKAEESVSLNWIRSPHNGASTFLLTCTFAISALNRLHIYLEDGLEEKKEFSVYYEWFRESRDNVFNNLDKISARIES